jgi:hypothetical protein
MAPNERAAFNDARRAGARNSSITDAKSATAAPTYASSG